MKSVRAKTAPLRLPLRAPPVPPSRASRWLAMAPWIAAVLAVVVVLSPMPERGRLAGLVARRVGGAGGDRAARAREGESSVRVDRARSRGASRASAQEN